MEFKLTMLIYKSFYLETTFLNMSKTFLLVWIFSS